MHRYLLAAAGFSLAGAIVFATLQPAMADEQKKAFCYEKKVLLAAGTSPTEFAAGATIFMNKMINEKAYNDFMMIEHADMEIICAWQH